MMRTTWLQDYILLAFRIDRCTQKAYGEAFVEAYYGPAEWRLQAEAEPETPPADLVRQAMSLADTLALQGFSTQRALYLGKRVQAMETVCRKLCGETLSLEKMAGDCLDIHPIWTSEAQFERAHALYETVLPGTGELSERFQTHHTELAFPPDQADLLTDVIERAFAEARQRTCALVEFPPEETITLQYRSDIAYDAAARYEGHYQTRIEMNVATTAAFISRLFDHKVCHEGYPGHHTEYVLKEHQLVDQQGYVEQTLVLTLCPQCTLTEGIAMVAHEMIFAEGEAERWICEHVYRLLHQEVDPTVLLHLRQASEMQQGIWNNAAILLDEGHSEKEVQRYFARYMLISEEKVGQMISLLKRPLGGLYQLTYLAGQQLLRPWLQGPERATRFRRLLSEQLLPSQVTGPIFPVF